MLVSAHAEVPLLLAARATRAHRLSLSLSRLLSLSLSLSLSFSLALSLSLSLPFALPLFPHQTKAEVRMAITRRNRRCRQWLDKAVRRRRRKLSSHYLIVMSFGKRLQVTLPHQNEQLGRRTWGCVINILTVVSVWSLLSCSSTCYFDCVYVCNVMLSFVLYRRITHNAFIVQDANLVRRKRLARAAFGMAEVMAVTTQRL